MLTTSGVRIESGTVGVFVDYPNGEMWTGSGQRQKSAHVAFAPAFHSVPTITVATAGIDAANSENLRISVSVSGASETGFNIVVTTWENSKLASVAVSWLAIGE